MDKTSKSLLAVIAALLLWIGVKDFSFVADAMAATGVIEVKVVEIDFSRYRPVPVEIKGDIYCRQR